MKRKESIDVFNYKYIIQGYMEKKTNNTMVYILFFSIGILLFLIITFKIYIPIYETLDGTIRVTEKETILEVEGYVSELEEKQIYYYINRDEWVEQAGQYDKDRHGFIIENVYSLSDETKVHVEFEKEKFSLFEIIFKKGGNI